MILAPNGILLKSLPRGGCRGSIRGVPRRLCMSEIGLDQPN
jgi:hypothetical protein